MMKLMEEMLPTKMLEMAVSLRISELQEKGGPTPEDWMYVREVSVLLGDKGGFGKCETTSVFNEFAKAIAIMSFVEGGVMLFGRRWETKT